MNEFTLERQFEVKQDHPYFDGHFPSLKIYPGVAQLQDVCDLLTIHLGSPVQLVQLSRVKFLQLIVPGTALTLKVAVCSNDSKVQWEFLRGDEVCGLGQGYYSLDESTLPSVAER